MDIPNFEFPKSPMTDEMYTAMKAWYNQKDKVYDWLNRMERSHAFDQPSIDAMRKQMDDSVKKLEGILKSFADLHPGA